MRLLILGSALLVSLGIAPSAMAWTWPLGGPVLRPYSLGPDAYAAGQHRGVDVAGTDGELVRAPASGTVSFVGVVPSSGKTVTIQLEGYAVSLTHLGATSIGKGASVTEGDPIGTAGTSGESEWPEPYVHLGVRVSSAADGYVDPLPLLPPRTVAPPSASPSDVAVPATVPTIGTGPDAPVVRSEPPAPRAESATPELRTPEPWSQETQTSQAPAQKQDSPKLSSSKPAGTTSDPAPVSASGQVTDATAIPIDPAPSALKESPGGEGVGRAALPGRAPSPTAVTDSTGGGSRTRPTIRGARADVRSGLPSAPTTVSVARSIPPPGVPPPPSTEIGQGNEALVDRIRAGHPSVPTTRAGSRAWYPGDAQDTKASPSVQTTATAGRQVGRAEESAPNTQDRRQPVAAEVRDRMPTAAMRDARPVARVRVWLTTALLLLLVVVGGGRWFHERERGRDAGGALLHHDVRVP